MKGLMEELRSSDCHFVRCIKPNSKKEPLTFYPQLTLQQIRYLGILETVRVNLTDL